MNLALELDARVSSRRKSSAIDDDPLPRAHPIRTKSMDFEELGFDWARTSEGKKNQKRNPEGRHRLNVSGRESVVNKPTLFDRAPWDC